MKISFDIERPIVCVQGLGYVGSAMAVAVAMAKDERGAPYFNVAGVELDSEDSRKKVDAINSGKLLIKNTDTKFMRALEEAHSKGNLKATTDPSVYANASVVVIDIHLDIKTIDGVPNVDFTGLQNAIRTIGEYAQHGTLIIVETTVPPGTCVKIIYPVLKECALKRGLSADAFLLAHAYERVMPGNTYYDSIVNFWRVFSGHTIEAADACEAFLSKVINVKEYSTTRLKSTTASEIGKVLENSYRAATIAFMEEWGRLAEAMNVDLFEVVDAIRVRPTHSNMRQPGFGVGGYCLTKDPLFPMFAAHSMFDLPELNFPFCKMAVEFNSKMPLVSLTQLEKQLGVIKGKTILLLGVSYRSDVGDTRYSPSQIFAEGALAKGAKLICHDPLVSYWSEMKMEMPESLPSADSVDAIVFAVGFNDYRNINISEWLGGRKPLIFDANKVLSESQITEFRRCGCRVWCIGRGECG